ncbi:MAG: hypothetical protein LBO00_00245 [Zoogloeaceae bacterium]|jgi:hypothetical protein|nr:hypothetical protein [Zoogloeaceae bacterium]
MEGLDMVFFVMPDAAPAPMVETVLVAKAPTSAAASSKVRKMTYGKCVLYRAIEGDEELDPAFNLLGIYPSMAYALESLGETTPTPGPYTDGASETWEDSFVLTVLREPKHGKLEYLNWYVPDKGYLGKDRFDILVKAKDNLGRPIAVTLRYYVNVLTEEDWSKAARDNRGYAQAIKKYCGATKGEWRISQPSADDYNTPDSWYRATSLQALLSNTSLGQAVGGEIKWLSARSPYG